MPNNNAIKRLRIFAGPNGSGKSTMFAQIKEEYLSPEQIGSYINPDEIEQSFNNDGSLNFSNFELNKVTSEILFTFLDNSSFLQSKVSEGHFPPVNSETFKIIDNNLQIPQAYRDSYFASIISDFIRNQLMLNGNTLTFESVMSSRDKIDVLQKAKDLGYRVYLYYISTITPRINIERVASRVAQNGHNVTETKIISRYHKSLENLFDASKYCYRVYFFDNSKDLKLIAQLSTNVTTGYSEYTCEVDTIPDWLQVYFINKIYRT